MYINRHLFLVKPNHFHLSFETCKQIQNHLAERELRKKLNVIFKRSGQRDVTFFQSVEKVFVFIRQEIIKP